MKQNDVNQKLKGASNSQDLINMGFEKEDKKSQERKTGIVIFLLYVSQIPCRGTEFWPGNV